MSKQIYDKRENESYLDWLERLVSYVENKEYDLWWDDIHELIVGYRVSPTESRKRCYLLRDLLPILKLEGLKSLDVDEVLDIKNNPITDEVKNDNDVDNNYNDKNDIDNSSKNKTIVTGQDEICIDKYKDCGDYYIVSSGKRSIEISKNKVKMIKRLYCGEDSLTINEICRKLNIPRRDFILVKNAFNITHDDIPYIDEELDDIDDLVEDTLERKKEKYFIKLQEKEIKNLKKEVNLYRNKDYLYDKVLDSLCDIKVEPKNFKIRDYTPSKKHGLLDLADWHVGLKAENYWNTYNSKELKNRAKRLTEKVIEIGTSQNIEVLHVSNLGDMIAGIIHDSIRFESEFAVTKQVTVATETIGQMLIDFAGVFKKVVYAGVSGNHGRIIPNKNASTDEENFENLIGWALRIMLSDFDNVEFEENYYDDNIISKNILGHLILETHGHNDKFNKVASDLSMMITKPMEIHMGHLHHNKIEEFHDVEVSICKSFSGVDTFAKNHRYTNKAGQKLYIYNKEGRECVYDIILN